MAFVGYKDLIVFKKAFGVAVDLHRATASFPKEELYGGMADQMRRASKSICANIAEGLSKGGSKIEQKRFLGMAMGSAEEMQVWLMFCVELGYLDRKACDAWCDDYIQIGKMLFALMERRKVKVAA